MLSLTVLLGALGVAWFALSVAAAATPDCTAREPPVKSICGLRTTVTEAVAAPGTYRVAVTISAPTRSMDSVDLLVGSVARRVTSDRRHHASVAVILVISAPTLNIQATSRRRAPRLAVTLRRLRAGSGVTPKQVTAPAAASPPAPAAAPTPTAPVVPTTPTPPAPAFPGSPVATTSSQGPVGVPGGWRLVFDDEFNGSRLDANNWSTGWLGASGISAPVNAQELECYDPSHVVVGGGELNLNLTQTTESCGRRQPYASGMITTTGKFSFTYGFVEARVWLPGSLSVSDWPAIWADGQSWPQDGELDVAEGLGGQACWTFHSPAGAPGGCAAAPFTGGWHTFGADWERGAVHWYYDGVPVGTVNSGVTGAPMFLVINLAADTTYGGPLQAPATLRVDYIRVWQH